MFTSHLKYFWVGKTNRFKKTKGGWRVYDSQLPTFEATRSLRAFYYWQGGAIVKCFKPATMFLNVSLLTYNVDGNQKSGEKNQLRLVGSWSLPFFYQGLSHHPRPRWWFFERFFLPEKIYQGFKTSSQVVVVMLPRIAEKNRGKIGSKQLWRWWQSRHFGMPRLTYFHPSTYCWWTKSCTTWDG